MQTILAADIGGTKSELAVFEMTGGSTEPLAQKKYNNCDFSQVTEVIARFVKESELMPQTACIAVAGVVSGRTAQMTNLPWEMNCDQLEKHFGFVQTTLINDLTAVCSSLPFLASEDLHTIQQGNSPGGSCIRGVVAPGTGLGEGLLVDVGAHYFAQGSEGGHSDFAPIDDEQLALFSWMRKQTQQVSYETLIAGPGLKQLYDFCMQYHNVAESPHVVQSMRGIRDRVPSIVRGAIEEPRCPLCECTLTLFLSILGSEAGNMALKVYARGGMYLGGGILPRLIDKVSFSGLRESFLRKGLMVDFMKEIPVHVIKRRDAALIGAFGFALRNMEP